MSQVIFTPQAFYKWMRNLVQGHATSSGNPAYIVPNLPNTNLASLQHPPFWSAWNYSGNFYYNCYTPPGMQQLHGDPP